jgi:hypothetical protein
MTVRKLLMSSVVIALIGTVALVGSLADVGASIREMYPSAVVTVHEGHSPGVHPLLSVMRLVRGRNFVPASKWIRVQLSDETKPVDLAKLLQFQVNSIQLTRCKVNDLAPLTRRSPSIYAEFIDCDLNAVPAEQTAVLQASTENPERLTYGGP